MSAIPIIGWRYRFGRTGQCEWRGLDPVFYDINDPWETGNFMGDAVLYPDGHVRAAGGESWESREAYQSYVLEFWRERKHRKEPTSFKRSAT